MRIQIQGIDGVRVEWMGCGMDLAAVKLDSCQILSDSLCDHGVKPMG